MNLSAKPSLSERDKRPPVDPPKTEGLTPLDRERAGSVADEGGASAATVETQKRPAEPHRKAPDVERDGDTQIADDDSEGDEDATLNDGDPPKRRDSRSNPRP